MKNTTSTFIFFYLGTKLWQKGFFPAQFLSIQDQSFCPATNRLWSDQSIVRKDYITWLSHKNPLRHFLKTPYVHVLNPGKESNPMTYNSPTCRVGHGEMGLCYRIYNVWTCSWSVSLAQMQWSQKRSQLFVLIDAFQQINLWHDYANGISIWYTRFVFCICFTKKKHPRTIMMKFSNALTTEEICVGSKLSSSDIMWKMKIGPTILVLFFL